MIQDLRIKEKGVFEKIVRREDGRVFRVQFVIFERDGVLRGKIVSCQEIYSLPIITKINSAPIVEKNKVVQAESPYFNVFDFLTKIKIRAPSVTQISI